MPNSKRGRRNDGRTNGETRKYVTMANSRKFSLDSNATIKRADIGTALEDPEDTQVLGHVMLSTTGELVVPHDWLEEQWSDVGLDERMMPSLPWTSSAYKRAMRFVVHPGVNDKMVHGGQKVELNLRDGNGNMHHLHASVFLPGEDDSAGRWEDVELVRFAYDADAQDMRVTRLLEEGDDEFGLESLVDETVNRARTLFDLMKKSHVGDDMRDVLYYFTHFNAQCVKMRDGGAVYFVPAHHGDTLEKLAEVWDRMNSADKVHKQGKGRGARTGIVTMPVFDTEDMVEYVESRVEQRLEEDLDRAIEAAFDRLEEDDDETAQEIVKRVTDDLSDLTSLEANYNDLLEAELDIKRLLNERYSSVSDEERKAIVEEVGQRLD